MTPELVAILLTAGLQSLILLVAVLMLSRMRKTLEGVEGVTAASFLETRKVEALVKALDEALK